jgi:putative PIN family toxin of toxin-antitoxin system
MKVVFDTNVLVAASRSRQGASFALLSMLPSTQFQVALSVSLFTEWQAVMTRPENLPTGMTSDDAKAFLRYLASIAHLQDVFYLWRPRLKDPDDDMVLECAVAAGCRYIVTHNVRDFAGIDSLGVQAIRPADFLALIRSPS